MAFPLVTQYHWLLLYLLCYICLVSSHNHFDSDCVEQNIESMRKKVQDVYHHVEEVYDVVGAKIHQVEDDGEVDLSLLWFTSKNGEGSAYLQDLKVNSSNIVTSSGKLESIKNVIFLDATKDRRHSAYISIENDGEEYLTVSTNNTATSCTIRLSSKADHGKVITSTTFGSFRFSPDGNYILYVAEEIAPEGRFKYLVRSYFEDKPRVYRPAIFMYDVQKFMFKRLQVQEGFSPGNLQWHPTTQQVVGVAWSNEDFRLQYPLDMTRKTRLFVIDPFSNVFRFISSSDNHHYYAPRISGDGNNLVFLANDRESSTVPKFIPGPYALSARLMLVKWNHVQEYLNAKEKDGYPVEYEKVEIIGNGQSGAEHPIELPDGTMFYGLYPYLDHIPDRIFSADGNTVYLTIKQLAYLKLLAVDINTKQITIHPTPEVMLLDILDDICLVRRGDVVRKPYLTIGRIMDIPPTTTTTEPSSSSSSTESSTTTPGSSTPDPCEHLFTELEVQDNTTGTTTTATISDETTISTTKISTSTSHPFATPLPLARTDLVNLTKIDSMDVSSTLYKFLNPNFKADNETTWTNNNIDSTFFNAWLVRRKNDYEKPLLVMVKNGPHSAWTQTYDPLVNMFLHLGMAVLVVNYRGSLGMGDEVAQSLIGNIGLMEVSDVHQAVQKVLSDVKDLNGEVVLAGEEYGGFIATHLAAQYPELYNILIVKNTFVDFSLIRPITTYVQGLLALNYTDSLVFDDQAFFRSPVFVIDRLNASTLILQDKEKDIQSYFLHSVLRSKNIKSRRFSYGKAFSHYSASFHQFTETVLWIHEHWGYHYRDCKTTTTEATTTTSKGGGGSTGTTPPINAAARSSIGQRKRNTFNFLALVLSKFIFYLFLQ